MNSIDPFELAAIEASYRTLDAWVKEEKFAGWEPHDALNSPALYRLAHGNRILSVAIVQALRRLPINLRPWLRVPKGYNPKAMGLFLESYSRSHLVDHDDRSLDRIRFLVAWLSTHSVTGYSGPCWGYHFAWPNRGFYAAAGTPTVVNTAYIGLALLTAGEALQGCPEKRDDHEPVGLARAACEFVLRDLRQYRPSNDEVCFSYTPIDERFVHNANLMGAWLLARVYRHTQEDRLADSALAAGRFSARKQRPDGSWPYGLGKKDQWVDNFHTGFVLLGLRHTGRNLGTDEFEEGARRGYEFWRNRMLIEGYIPKYYPDRLYPIDIHCVAQAILTFLEFSDVDPGALNNATRLCRWAIGNLQDARGYFHYQIHSSYRIRIPYMRWGQAWMHLALTQYLRRIRSLACLEEAVSA